MEAELEYKIIALDKIVPGKFQLRYDIAEELQELAESIRLKGVLQSICVSPNGKGYEIVWGHRRYFASLLANMKDIPCQIKKNISNEDKLKFALIENAQRKQLNPIEEAKTYKQLLEELKITQEELGEIAGKDRTVIVRTIKLLTLPKEIRDGVARATISPGHAREILRIDDEVLQLKIYAIVVENNLSVRETERGVNRLLKKQKEDGKETVRGRPDMLFFAICDWMTENLGTDMVRFKECKHKQKIELSFKTTDKLIEIVGKLSKLKLNKDNLESMQKTYEKKLPKSIRDGGERMKCQKIIRNDETMINTSLTKEGVSFINVI
ncbi:MAG: ParB/RepB/Spo0J family partition protein [bacterium]|nr:ParB/RepB/Spo0J family partition protein [bacterium]